MYYLSPPEGPLHEALSGIGVVTVTKHQEQYADIPFKATLQGTVANVFTHSGTLREARGVYIEGVTSDEVKIALESISVASAVIRERFRGSSIAQVARYYHPLSNPDDITRRIFDDFESERIEGPEERFLLQAFRDDAISVDITRINAIRLCALNSLEEGLLDRFSHAAKLALKLEIRKNRPHYESVVRAFGGRSPLERAKMFANSLPHSMLALAFPMDKVVSEELIDLLPNSD